MKGDIKVKKKIYGEKLEKGERWKKNMKRKLYVISNVSDLVCVACSSWHDSIFNTFYFCYLALSHAQDDNVSVLNHLQFKVKTKDNIWYRQKEFFLNKKMFRHEWVKVLNMPESCQVLLNVTKQKGLSGNLKDKNEVNLETLTERSC